ncbi:hypothetical protein, conserved [Trypanosoma cruzi]|uniref:Uncharacterized protein n=1 Tax=Trypanosoma cruzi (strain CL Brener) TaxID=353153 RepID=Q4DXE2_TRYCC|nr:hypothetical protein, conserved [Trypanosoma cruzi]EAN97200.1 hypothetical protein, conserved [Trypanosoma cruzi]|eukprot:XP_819051.1 hypothetical protein [Trypanosoma cruzi strain CL Brener]
MSWIVIDRSSKGSISSFPSKMQRTRPRTALPVRPGLQRNGSAGSEKKRSQKEEKKDKKERENVNSSRRNNRPGSSTRRKQSNGKKFKKSLAAKITQGEFNAVPPQKDEKSHRLLDEAWEKFGEARVLTRQNCFQAAWKTLIEAKDHIDSAADSCCCGSERHGQALVQLGHELNAVTQRWLQWEGVLLRSGSVDSPLEDSTPAKAAVRANEKESRTPGLEGREENNNGTDEGREQPGKSGALTGDTLPKFPHPTAESKTTTDFINNRTDVYVQSGEWMVGAASPNSRPMTSPLSPWSCSRPQDTWSSPASRNSAPNQYSLYSKETCGRPTTKFSDGIIFAMKGQREKTALQQSLPSVSFSEKYENDLARQAQQKEEQQQQQMEGKKEADAKEEKEKEGEVTTKETPGCHSPAERSMPSLQGAAKQLVVTAQESACEKPAPAETDAPLVREEIPRPEKEEQQQKQQKQQSEGGLEEVMQEGQKKKKKKGEEEPPHSASLEHVVFPSTEMNTLVAEATSAASEKHSASMPRDSNYCGVSDLGEPESVPLYAFELEKLRKNSGNEFQVGPCNLPRSHSARPPTAYSVLRRRGTQSRTVSNSCGQTPLPAMSSLPFESSALLPSQNVAGENMNCTGGHGRTGDSVGGLRFLLPYVSVYSTWQAGSRDQHGNDMQPPHAKTPKEDLIQSSPSEKGCLEKDTAGASANLSQLTGDAHDDTANMKEKETSDYSFQETPHVKKDEAHNSVPLCERGKLFSAEPFLRSYFDGVKSYQEARELHQQMVQSLLQLRVEEDEEEDEIGQRAAGQTQRSCAAQMLGRLEEVYYDWLIDHLGIRKRHGRDDDDPVALAANVNGVGNTPKGHGENSVQSSTISATTACSTMTQTPTSMPMERLEAALNFGRVLFPTATLHAEENVEAEKEGGKRTSSSTEVNQTLSKSPVKTYGNGAEDGTGAAHVVALAAVDVNSNAETKPQELPWTSTAEAKKNSKIEGESAPQLPRGDSQEELVKTNVNKVTTETHATAPRRFGRTLVFVRDRRF